MAYDDEQIKRSRVVIETPTARREVVQTVSAREPVRRGVSTGVVAALVIGSVALVTILFLFILNRQQDAVTEVNANVTRSATAPTPVQPVIIEQAPAPQTQPPIIIQQPATTTTTQPPVIIEQPAPATAPPATTSRPSGTDDTAIQSEIDKRMAEDSALSTLGVTATVLDGKVTLIGTVETQALKNQVERMVKAIKGVRSVDNQVIVSAT
ncbi:MAG TPA: BON domain-containing protein [Pyrinomonadaceae bacterium]|nr:BON domain-containing protein [Pyrinomonadaceae bacterium]